MKYTLVLSDIHLGSPLVHNKLELNKLLESDRYDTIVLNGDIFDIWEESFNKILLDNLEFVKIIHSLSIKKTVYFIIGNHDPYISEVKRLFPGMRVLDRLYLDDILIIHGHEFDNLVTKYLWFAKLLFIPNWISERLFHINLKAFFREFFYSVSNKQNKPYFNELINDIEKEAVGKYKNECRYLIMGHTHTPKIVEGEDCTYINCGDILHNKVCIEYDEDKNFQFVKVG